MTIFCQICRWPGVGFCSDAVACNFRARRRLGLPLHVCVEERARDLELLAGGEHRRAARLKALPPRSRNAEYESYITSTKWRAFADEQKLMAGHRCERPGCGLATWEVEAHHIDYRRLGRERPQDVLVLCPACHRELDDLREQGQRPMATVVVRNDRRVVEWAMPTPEQAA